MPHGETLITLLLKKLGLYEGLLASARALSRPFNHEGVSWIAKQPIGLTHVLSALLVLFLLVVIGIVVHRKIRNVDAVVVPEGKLTLRTFVELLVSATYDRMKEIMGPKAAKFFLPLIGTCALFILFSNAMGLVPGFEPPTSNLNTTAACAVVIFFTTHVYGVKEHGLAYFKHFFGPILKWYALPLMLLMLAIETIGHLARPMSLSIRLMGNMTVDHTVVGVFQKIFPFLLPLPMMILGTVVVVVQTLVFCILSTVYISMAIQHEEH